MSMAVNHERRERLKQAAFNEYYNELNRIHNNAGIQGPFTYDQVYLNLLIPLNLLITGYRVV
jgi:hypothetical protein